MPVVYYEAVSNKTGKVIAREERKSWLINSLKHRHISTSKVTFRKVYKNQLTGEYSPYPFW